MAKRHCDECRGTIPDRMSRQRNDKGNLVCEECKKMKTPDWPVHSSLTPSQAREFKRRAAEAMRSIIRLDSKRRVAHDSGDNAIINHCAFCGSGAVTGGSDGSVDCGYCHSVFTVQVQPAHPNMPQTIDGTAMPPPGMPAGQETELSAPVDPAVDEDASGAPTDGFGDAEVDPAEEAGVRNPAEDQDPDEDSSNPVPPQFKSSSRFFTASGEVLDVERYANHLALEFSDDRLAVLSSVRDRNS